MTQPPPAADSRSLGLAHYAARGVLEAVLDRYGLTFRQQLALRLVVLAPAPVEHGALVAEVHDALKSGAAGTADDVAALTAKGLVAPEGSRLRATDEGRALHSRITTEVGGISARVWAGLPAADLAAAGRVLAQVKERADAELAALTA
ncbi:MarR family transcriptional regulator [Streptomyces sp. NPDC023723]|uniref:MarR family transcriptional regulator n=1 Tax=Streptomyces sp. NPDC023723 TaxID=3154323 RepID=UPI0033C57C35